MIHQSAITSSTPHQPSRVLENLVGAYLNDKKGVRYVMYENRTAVFQKCRPHSVLAFGIAHEDPRNGSVRVIMSHDLEIPSFSMLFRSHKSDNSSFIVFEDGLELASDGPYNFAAFFCVKYQELEEVALYTVSKWGTETRCTENYSAHHSPPTHFCETAFAILGGMKHAT